MFQACRILDEVDLRFMIYNLRFNVSDEKDNLGFMIYNLRFII